MAQKKGNPVRLNMTGEEFKKLLERKDPNNVVDTLNEVLAMFEGISDNETIAEYVQRTVSETVTDEVVEGKVKEQVDAMTAEDEDIEDMFSSEDIEGL